MIEGTIVKMGEVEYTIAPLTFKQLRTLQPRIDLISKMDGTPTPEQMDAVVDIIHASVTRNHPDVTKDQIDDVLDLGNVQLAMASVMGASGMVKKIMGVGS